MRAFSRTFPLLLLAMVLSTAPALAAGHAGVVTLEVDLSAQGKGEEALLWIPYPVSDADQLVSDVRISGDYASAAVYTDRENGTPILAARWDKAAASRSAAVTCRWWRQPGIPPISPITCSRPGWVRLTAR
jgi:hypothetical protein